MTSSGRRARGLLGDSASSILRPRLLQRLAPAGPAPSGPAAVVCTERAPLAACCAAARPRRRESRETATGRRTCGDGRLGRRSNQRGRRREGGKAPQRVGWGQVRGGGCSAAWSAWVQGGGRAERPAARRPAKRAPPRRVSPAWCTAEWAAWAATAAGGKAAAWLRVLRPWGGPGGAESGGLGGLVLEMRLLDALGKTDCQVAVTQAGGGWGAMRARSRRWQAARGRRRGERGVKGSERGPQAQARSWRCGGGAAAGADGTAGGNVPLLCGQRFQRAATKPAWGMQTALSAQLGPDARLRSLITVHNVWRRV